MSAKRPPPPRYYREYRGWGWLLARFAGALLGSIGVGVVAGVLNGAAQLFVVGSGPFSSPLRDLEHCALVGGSLGAAGSTLMLLVTTSRYALLGFAVVAVGTSAMALVWGFADEFLGGLSPLITICAYVVGCIAWRCIKGGDGWVDVPGACVECGYDLGGISAASCPECGTKREQSVWADASL